jgi:hypothetical protein
MSTADVGARVYGVIDNDVYTAPGMANMAFVESILVRMTGDKPHKWKLPSNII